MYKVCYWDSESNQQRERNATEDEAAEIDARKNAGTPVPDRVPMLNAHLVLIDAGLMGGVNDYLAAIPGPEGEKARAYFVQALTMERSHPLVLGFQAALNKTDAEVDEMFIAAEALNV